MRKKSPKSLRAEQLRKALRTHQSETTEETRLHAKNEENLPVSHTGITDPLEDTALQTDLFTQCLNADAKTVLFTGAIVDADIADLVAKFADTLSNDARIKTLLIDCNFRKPSQHNRFTCGGSDTLLDIVKNNAGIDGLIPTERDNLYVLPAGGSGLPEPAAVFRSDAFGQLLLRAREKFSLVILDGPPVSYCAESRYLSSKVDGVILVLEAEKTRRYIALEAKKSIEKVGGRVLGVILNNVKHRIPEWLYRRI